MTDRALEVQQRSAITAFITKRGQATEQEIVAAFLPEVEVGTTLAHLSWLEKKELVIWNKTNETYTMGKIVAEPRLESDFSHLFEPPPGKIAVLADSTDEMKIGLLYVIRFGSATAGTVCATYDSFESPEGLGTVECFWKVGDRVLFGPNAGMSFTMDVSGSRRTFRVMGEKEILTRVKQSAQELAEKAVEVE